MPQTVAVSSSDWIRDLRRRVSGRVTVPGDAGYDDARRIFFQDAVGRPSAVVRPADAADVARVVEIARERGVELAVRSGGHSTAGWGTTEGGVVLDVRSLRGLDVDADGRAAWAGPGLTAGEYTEAVGQRGLVTGFGDHGSVGVSGITLGGGVGYLARSHGLTIDDLLAAEVVTADGRVRQVDAENEPDLFWAIRGGGGNFGVATRLRFRLHALPTVVGGTLVLPATPAVVASFFAAAADAGDALTVIAGVMKAPPMPFLPVEHHGRPVIMARLAYAGDAASAAIALAPFRVLARPLFDDVREIPYPALYPPAEEFRGRYTGRTLYLDRIDGAAAEAILSHLERATAPMAAVQLRVLGGAVAQVPDHATAYAHRSRPILAMVGAMYEEAAEAARHQEWVDGVVGTLHQGYDGVYVNFLGRAGPEAVRNAYPGATWDRLVEVKTRYDPDNLFRRNHNIPPAPHPH